MAVKQEPKRKSQLPPNLLGPDGKPVAAVPAAKFDGTALPAQNRIPLPTKKGTTRTLPGPGVSIGQEEKLSDGAPTGGAVVTAREEEKNTTDYYLTDPDGSFRLNPDYIPPKSTQTTEPERKDKGPEVVAKPTPSTSEDTEKMLRQRASKGETLSPSELLRYAQTSGVLSEKEIEDYLTGKAPIEPKKLSEITNKLGQVVPGSFVPIAPGGLRALGKPLDPATASDILASLRAGKPATEATKDLPPAEREKLATGTQKLYDILSKDPKFQGFLRDMNINALSSEADIARVVTPQDLYTLYERSGENGLTSDMITQQLLLQKKLGVALEPPEEGSAFARILAMRPDMQKQLFGAAATTVVGDYKGYSLSLNTLTYELAGAMGDPDLWYKMAGNVRPPDGALKDPATGSWVYSDANIAKDPDAINALTNYQVKAAWIESMKSNVDVAFSSKQKSRDDEAAVAAAQDRYTKALSTGNFTDAVSASTALTNATRTATESKAMWDAITSQFSLFRDPDALALWNNAGGLADINAKYNLNIKMPSKASRQEVLTLVQTDPSLRAAMKTGNAGTIAKAMRSIVMATSWTSDELIALVQGSLGAGSMAGAGEAGISTVERE
ncbi:MAG TPA: hypothetical protein ACFYED_00190 [Candidatus Tripitaka californicus]|uniref:hypothetical protein n=1 Tax=Candidatus Tripitaka californicus TaxID=3367616 RepID=UPI0040263C93